MTTIAEATSRAATVRQARRGVVLLEVLVALALLIFGLALVGLQINAGVEAARNADVATRAIMLVDTKMSELAAGVLMPQPNEQEMTGDFGLHYPGYTWRLLIKETEIENQKDVTLEIGYNPVAAREQIANPSKEITVEDTGTRIVQVAHRLLPAPADVNLDRDFGLGQQELEKWQQKMEQAQANQPPAGGGGGQIPTGGGGGGGAPPQVGGLGSMNELLQALSALMAGGNFDPRMLSDLPMEELGKYSDMLEMMLGRKGGMAQSADQLLQQLLGNDRRGGRRGGRGGDRGGRRPDAEQRDGELPSDAEPGPRRGEQGEGSDRSGGRFGRGNDAAGQEDANEAPEGRFGARRNPDREDGAQSDTGGRRGRPRGQNDTGSATGGSRGRGRGGDEGAGEGRGGRDDSQRDENQDNRQPQRRGGNRLSR